MKVEELMCAECGQISFGKDDWLIALRKKINREQSLGITHLQL